MNIVVIGSAPRSLVNFRGPLIKTLVERGNSVLACAPKAPANIRKALTDLGARYYPIPMGRAGLNPWQDLETFLAIRKVFAVELPDRVLAYTAKPVIYSCLAARAIGRVPVFAMITGLGYGFGNASRRQKLVGVVLKNLYRGSLRHASGVMFQNPDDRALFVKAGLVPRNLPTTLINGSGIDLTAFAPAPLPQSPVFLLVARLLLDKGLREYYRAAYALKNRYPQARFLLAGDLDPNPRSIQEAELTAWQRNGTIEYLGYLDDVRPAIKAAQVYVLPSYREGTPRTVLEAMAMGRPIVTSDATGCRETVINRRNGFLVPIGDPEGLARAMQQFILSPELAQRMGLESLALAREKYDVQKVNAAILKAMKT